MNSYGEVFAQFYDNHFGNYAEKAAPYLLRFFASRKVFESHSRVLDLGCGTGQVALRFLEADYLVTGLDSSPHMLFRAENRCRRYLLAGNACFVKEDFSDFHFEEPFDLILSTYNSLNHLNSEAKFRSCFRAVRKCLKPDGFFLFDFHTLSGLKEWVSSESGQWESEAVEIHSEFDGVKGAGVMRLKGQVAGKIFEETILNWSFPLKKVESWLKQEGFSQVLFSQMNNLETPLQDPEQEKRVVLIAC